MIQSLRAVMDLRPSITRFPLWPLFLLILWPLTENMDLFFFLFLPQHFTVFPKNLEGTLETINATQRK